jgi:hypothetical protein
VDRYSSTEINPPPPGGSLMSCVAIETVSSHLWDAATGDSFAAASDRLILAAANRVTCDG